MIELILKAVSMAFFAWFFEFAIDEVPYLKWYGHLLKRLPDYLSDPLGLCPYCLAPWLILLCLYAPIPQEYFYPFYAFGWAYVASVIFSKFGGDTDV